MAFMILLTSSENIDTHEEETKISTLVNRLVLMFQLVNIDFNYLLIFSSSVKFILD